MSPPEFTYPEVGATHHGTLPDGYHHVRVRERIGLGRAAFEAAAEAVMGWNVHRGSGLRVRATAERAQPGANVTSYLGTGPARLAIPCRVVWTIDAADRVGFGYGTLPGHPETGEESFVVEIDDHDAVWFTVTAFSRPNAWYTRIAGPIARRAQALATRRYVTAARRFATDA